MDNSQGNNSSLTGLHISWPSLGLFRRALSSDIGLVSLQRAFGGSRLHLHCDFSVSEPEL
jgi:hypothetical protein